MKSPLGLAAYKSIGIHRGDAPYDVVASEYYDERLHPTCADFRTASRFYLQRLFKLESPRGRIADVGCGRSLLTEFVLSDLVLVDESTRMLLQNGSDFQNRLANVEMESFGVEEFDWIFAILADPYNTLKAWKHIRESMKPGGRCVFVVPSITWATNFRKKHSEERNGLARFVLSDGRSVYLRSLILSASDQRDLITSVGLKLVGLQHVLAGDLPTIRSAKISEYLSAADAVLDVYRAEKTT